MHSGVADRLTGGGVANCIFCFVLWDGGGGRALYEAVRRLHGRVQVNGGLPVCVCVCALGPAELLPSIGEMCTVCGVVKAVGGLHMLHCLMLGGRLLRPLCV